MSPAELHEQLTTNADHVLRGLLSYRANTSPFNGTTWHDAADLIVQAIQEWPDDGFLLVEQKSVIDPCDRLDLARATIRGWATAPLDNHQVERIVGLLRANIDLRALADDIASFLFERAKEDQGGFSHAWLPAARRLAIEVWAATAPGQTDDSDHDHTDDWMFRAINDWAGKLAEFWIRTISIEWRDAVDSWPGIGDEAKTQLETMLTNQAAAGHVVQVILASQLHFIFGADSAWCTTHLLPLLDWNIDEDRATRAWHGYLHTGRWHDRLLNAGLLGHYLATLRYLDRLSENLRRSYLHHLASIALESESDPVEQGWLQQFTIEASPATRADLWRSIGWHLDDRPHELAESRWHTWMKPYWTERLKTVPRPITNDEASAMAEWVTRLDASLPDAVALAIQHPAGIHHHTNFLHDLVTKQRAERWPREVNTLVAHMLGGTSAQPFYECHQLSAVVQVLRTHLRTDDLKPIVERALQLGCSDAAGWTQAADS